LEEKLLAKQVTSDIDILITVQGRATAIKNINSEIAKIKDINARQAICRPDEENGGYKSFTHAVDPARYLVKNKSTELGTEE
jgi:hypothetical protein